MNTYSHSQHYAHIHDEAVVVHSNLLNEIQLSISIQQWLKDLETTFKKLESFAVTLLFSAVCLLIALAVCESNIGSI